MVAALGLADALVGRTWECDAPGTEQVPIVSWTGLPEGLSPAEIDGAVRERVADGSPLYRLDAEAIAAAEPDLILTQDLCRVCAVPSGDVGAALGVLGCRAEVLSLDPGGLDEVLADVVRVGEVTGRAARAAEVVAGLHERLDAVRASVAGRASVPTLVLEWTDPPFGPGHWLPDVVAVAGGQALLGEPGGRSVPLDWGAVAEAGAEAVLVVPCGMGIDEAEAQARALLAAERPGVGGARVAAADALAHFVRPGPRLVDSAEALAAFLHPGARPEQPDVVRAIR